MNVYERGAKLLGERRVSTHGRDVTITRGQDVRFSGLVGFEPAAFVDSIDGAVAVVGDWAQCVMLSADAASADPQSGDVFTFEGVGRYVVPPAASLGRVIERLDRYTIVRLRRETL